MEEELKWLFGRIDLKSFIVKICSITTIPTDTSFLLPLIHHWNWFHAPPTSKTHIYFLSPSIDSPAHWIVNNLTNIHYTTTPIFKHPRVHTQVCVGPNTYVSVCALGCGCRLIHLNKMTKKKHILQIWVSNTLLTSSTQFQILPYTFHTFSTLTIPQWVIFSIFHTFYRKWTANPLL